MGLENTERVGHGQWMALVAALLGWMFDGLEMGLFPLVARPALQELLHTHDDAQIGLWMSAATAAFLIGAATGGVLFGWLGDRLGRVRAMMLSVLTYALFSGLCALALSAGQIAVLRFLAALGMGGEWSLGVALVMEIWPNRSRGLLAGLIGAAGNAGYLLIAVVSLWLGFGWRWIMICGAAPAFLTVLIRLFVPESQRWLQEERHGLTTNWAARDLAGVGIGAFGAGGLIYLHLGEFGPVTQILGSALALALITVGYIYPVVRYLQRSASASTGSAQPCGPTVRHMLLGACLGGVALLGTWASIQWAPLWADKLTGGEMPRAKAYTQICSAGGAIVGCMGGALLGNWLSRRVTYSLLCLGSLGSALVFFQLNDHYGLMFLGTVFLAGGFTASFYGWLPLYLPELFRTAVRATAQGFSFNFGRILAAIGVLQVGHLMARLGGSYSHACSVMSLVYIAGLALVWLAPETRGQPLPP